MRFTRPISIATLGALLTLAGCKEEQAPQEGFAFPPPQVAVLTVKAEDVPITNELPGRIAATRIAEVRPRASGILVDRVFQQGAVPVRAARTQQPHGRKKSQPFEEGATVFRNHGGVTGNSKEGT